MPYPHWNLHPARAVSRFQAHYWRRGLGGPRLSQVIRTLRMPRRNALHGRTYGWSRNRPGDTHVKREAVRPGEITGSSAMSYARRRR